MVTFRGLAPIVLVRRIAILAGAAMVVTAALTGDPMDALAGAFAGEHGGDILTGQTVAGFGWGSTEP